MTVSDDLVPPASGPADLVIPAAGPAELAEILSWDAARAASFSVFDFPIDVIRFEGSSSPPVAVARARRTETLRALPASLRERAAGALERAERLPPALRIAGGRRIDLSQAPVVIGILNVTPDSFSDGGLYTDPARAVERALEMFEQGAAIVDVGGESTRPATYGAAREVPEAEELSRVLPVLEGIRRHTGAPLSIDTRKAGVARAAVEAGADCINDVSALGHDPGMAGVAGEAGAGVILMHMKGDDPSRMQQDTTYVHPISDIASRLASAAARAVGEGVARESIAVDPGLGFGKSAEGNLLLLRHLAAFRSLGFPVVAGASRKGFVRRYSGVAEDARPEDRLPGSLAAAEAAAAGGASFVRVHDVLATARLLRMRRAIRAPEGRPVAAPAAATR